jgi:hypothetical protein
VPLTHIKKLGGKEGRIENQRHMGDIVEQPSYDPHRFLGESISGQTPMADQSFGGGSTPMNLGNSTPGGVHFGHQATPLPEPEPSFAQQDQYELQRQQDEDRRIRIQHEREQQERQYYDQQRYQQQQPEANSSATTNDESAAALMNNWVQERAVVRIKQQGEHYYRSGVVTSVSPARMCSIDVTEPTPVGIIEVPQDWVEPVLPEKGDDVLIVGTDVDEEMKGKVGKLNNIDDTDAVVTVESLGLQFFDMRDLCKLIPK